MHTAIERAKRLFHNHSILQSAETDNKFTIIIHNNEWKIT